MKTLVAFLVVLITASSGFGQSRTLINRVDRQVGEPTARIEHQVESRQAKIAQPAGAPEEKSFEVIFNTPNVIVKDNYVSLSIGIKNISQAPINLLFYRTQTLPEGWMTNVCDPNQCHAPDVYTLPIEKAYPIEVGQEVEYHLMVTSMPSSVPDTGKIHLSFMVAGGNDYDTSGIFVVAASESQGAVSTANAKSLRPTIRSIYPSPIITGNSINVNVETRKEVSYQYSIYDPFGREAAFGTSQRKLGIGANTFRITSLEGLGSGSYILKLNFSDGSSDMYPFSVLR